MLTLSKISLLPMKHYRPLLIPEIGLRVGSLEIRSLRMNRHTPENQVGSHRHEEFDQIIVCIQGRCQLRINDKSRGGRPGAVLVVPKGVRHAFIQSASAPSLCLVLDVVIDRDPEELSLRSDLTAPELSGLKARISTLFRLAKVESPNVRFEVVGVLGDVLDPVLKAIGYLRRDSSRTRTAAPQPMARMLDRLLAKPGSNDLDISEIAQRLGYQQDHLNRRLKSETGLTIGQYRSRLRLQKAQQFLRGGRSVQESAELAGFPDKNYFSRWFRQQTGMTATAWRRENVATPMAEATEVGVSATGHSSRRNRLVEPQSQSTGDDFDEVELPSPSERRSTGMFRR